MTIVARPTFVFSHTDFLTFSTSDGAYTISVTYNGTNAPVTSPQVVQLVEYFHTSFGHYFLTHLPVEIVKLDNGTFAGWSRTGSSINAWTSATAGSAPVCRFFSEKFAPKSSHFYTSFASRLCCPCAAGGQPCRAGASRLEANAAGLREHPKPGQHCSTNH